MLSVKLIICRKSIGKMETLTTSVTDSRCQDTTADVTISWHAIYRVAVIERTAMMMATPPPTFEGKHSASM